MTKCTYRIIPRKHGPACDVEMTKPGDAPCIVNTFNSEAEAWEWVDEQQQVERFARRLSRNSKDNGRLE